jgi:RNase P/RNase MRP subunit p29
VVDETKSTVTVKTETGEKKLIKAQCDFIFTKGGARIRVKGELLEKRPEDRIKSR